MHQRTAPFRDVKLKKNSGGQRRENRGAEDRGAEDRGAVGAENRGAEGGGVWGRGVPLPTGGGIWGGGCAPSPEIFFDFRPRNSVFGAFWALYFTIQLPCFTHRIRLYTCRG